MRSGAITASAIRCDSHSSTGTVKRQQPSEWSWPLPNLHRRAAPRSLPARRRRHARPRNRRPNQRDPHAHRSESSSTVPYLKISRDKRGYETYYLLEPSPDSSRQTRPRILFWFRTPPQVKVGREPFSEEIRQAIESQNPDLRFDWPRLMATQPPPLDVQRWRERRRLERAARQAAREAPESEAEVAAAVANGAE